jgi:dihydropyrimidinase
MKILLRNGTIVNGRESKSEDILIHDGSVSAVGAGLPEGDTDSIIDAGGMYILPGGVDPHVHMHLPGPAGYSSDDFSSGSRAALYGGTTTLFDFVTPARGESLTGALDRRMAEAKDSLADFSFHVSPVEWRKTTGDEIRECISRGVTSFKVYMAYKKTIGLDDADILKVMQAVAHEGGIVTVHCETGEEIEARQNRYFCAGYTDPGYHLLSRPPETESDAVAKAIGLAARASCTLYIVHVSAAGSLKHIRKAQAAGQRVFAETCPQYLLFNDSKYHGDFNNTVPYVMSPPLRTEKDRESLWEAVADGTVSTVGTDHCPYYLAQKETGLSDFRKIPGGAGGVEHRLALLYTFGVLEKRITVNRLVELCSANPAKIFGVFPKKGDISAGADADIVIWNPGYSGIISAETHHQNCDINIYGGVPVRGNADRVMAGGKVIIEKGVMREDAAAGNYLFRTIRG